MDDICEWTKAVNETTNFRCNEGSISGLQLSKDGLTKIYCCMLNKVNLEYINYSQIFFLKRVVKHNDIVCQENHNIFDWTKSFDVKILSLEDFSKQGYFKEITEIHLNTGRAKKSLVTKQPLETKQPLQMEECLLFPLSKDSRIGGSFPSLSSIVDGEIIFIYVLSLKYLYYSGVVNKVKGIIDTIIKIIKELFNTLLDTIMSFLSGILKKVAIYGLIAGCFVIVLLVIYCM